MLDFLGALGEYTVKHSLRSVMFCYAVAQDRSGILHIPLEKQGVSCKPECLAFFPALPTLKTYFLGQVL